MLTQSRVKLGEVTGTDNSQAGNSNGTVDTIDGLEDFLRKKSTNSAPNADGKPSEGTENDTTKPDPNPAQPTGAEQTQTPDAAQIDKADKDAKAFAQMRVENANLRKTLEGAAELLGLDPKATDFGQKLKDNILSKRAEAQGVPKEILAKIESLEEKAAQSDKIILKENALDGFSKVKVQYKLTDEELNNFAKELASAGKNPFETEGINVLTEYRDLHFDEIVAKAAGVSAEAARQQKVAENASTPGDTSGQMLNNTSDKKIETIDGLEEFLKQKPK